MQQTITRLRVRPETLRMPHLALDNIASLARGVRRLRPEFQTSPP